MKNLLKSFVYAFRGITYCIAHERNMRIHLCFAAYMFGFLTVHDFFEVSRTQFALLFTVCAAVMALEAVNTAVEKAVDLETKELNPLAKISKDAAAGAVLIAAIGAVAAGISILWQPDAFVRMFNYYKENIPVLIGFVISFIASLIFVFAGPCGISSFFKKHVK
ncbi:MAG: diacylglycerol kinase family protein [Clostridia bacterium]|nr:diacylglycerol kinase family protein [Clostridia bacterium]